jgi:hypothetical protein
MACADQGLSRARLFAVPVEDVIDWTTWPVTMLMKSAAEVSVRKPA